MKTTALHQTKRIAYSIKEAADALGLGYGSVRKLILAGELKANVKLKKYLIPATELERFINS